MADSRKPLVSLTARVSLDKKEIYNELMSSISEAQKIVHANDIEYKITADSSSIENVLKKINSLNPEIGASLNLIFDQTDISRQFSELTKYSGKEAATIASTFKSEISKSFEKSSITSLLGDKLPNKENLRGIFDSLKSQIDTFDMGNITGIDDLKNQAYKIKQLQDFLKDIKKPSFSKYLNPDSLGISESDAKSMYNKFVESASQVIYQKQSQWANNLQEEYESAFKDIKNMVNNILSGSGVSSSGLIGDEIDRTSGEIKELESIIQNIDLKKLRSEVERTYSSFDSYDKSGIKNYLLAVQELAKAGGELNADEKRLYNKYSRNENYVPLAEIRTYSDLLSSATQKSEVLKKSLVGINESAAKSIEIEPDVSAFRQKTIEKLQQIDLDPKFVEIEPDISDFKKRADEKISVIDLDPKKIEFILPDLNDLKSKSDENSKISIQVVPDLTNFKTELDEVVKKSQNDLKIKIPIQVSDFKNELNFDDELQNLGKIGLSLQRLLKKIQEITTAYEVQEKTLISTIDRENNLVLSLTNVLSSLYTNLISIETKIKELPPIDFKIDTTGLNNSTIKNFSSLIEPIKKLNDELKAVNINKTLGAIISSIQRLNTLPSPESLKNLDFSFLTKVSKKYQDISSFSNSIIELSISLEELRKTNIDLSYLESLKHIKKNTCSHLESLAQGFETLGVKLGSFDSNAKDALNSLKEVLSYTEELKNLATIVNKKTSSKTSPNNASTGGIPNVNDLDETAQKYKELTSIIERFRIIESKIKSGASVSDAQRSFYDKYKNEIEKAIAATDEYKASTKAAKDAQQKFNDTLNQVNASLSANRKLLSNDQRNKYISDISNYMDKNQKVTARFGAELDKIILRLRKVEFEDEAKEIISDFRNIQYQARQMGLTTFTFIDKIKLRFADLGAYLASFASFYEIIAIVRRGFEIVKEIDKVNIELRKVSDATDSRLAVSFDNSTESAKELGATISDVVSATADWSRLGYDIDAAEELARVATIYKNVGDGIDIEAANNSLTSTLQGFELEAKDAMNIVDQFNEVANNFPIDTAGIGEALQRSAASFNAANTSLSESIALITATMKNWLVVWKHTIKNIFNCWEVLRDLHYNIGEITI